MSVKYFDKGQNKWVIFPGTIGAPGKDAYLIAQENGYTGTKEEYAKVLVEIPRIIKSIEDTPKEGSKNLITSGGVWKAVDDLDKSTNNKIGELDSKITTNTNNINDINNTQIPNKIKESIIDNLNSTKTDKSLSANQGRILKEMISNLANLQFTVVPALPPIGESNIIYLVKKAGSKPDVYNEYIYLDNDWEKIGDTEVDLSNYYTKSEVNSLITDVESEIPTIPDIEVEIAGNGNVITNIDVDVTNKHKIKGTKSISIYTKQEVDDKIVGLGSGDVIAAASFTTADRVITSNDVGKVVKDSGILINNLALKSDMTWNSIQNKPSTFTPSAHTHVLADITDAGALAGKDKVDESDLNFNIPEGVVVDSVLSTTSENPVQNKVITAQLNNKVNNATLSSYVKTTDLNTTLENYYLKTETYTKSEVDEKIGSAGGGDVMAASSLVENNIVLGAGTKSVKDSGITLSNLATQEWVKSQGYISSVPALPIASRAMAGIVTTDAQDFAGRKTFYGGIDAQDADLANLVVGNTLELNGQYFNNHASSEIYGGLKIGYTGSAHTVPLQLDGTGKAYIALTTSSIMAGLGGINGKPQLTMTTITKGTGDITIKEEFDDIENVYNYTLSIPDIPSIPVALPNPYSLSITANGSTNTYTGSSAVSINLDNIFSKKLQAVTTPGHPGIYFTTQTTQVTVEPRVTETSPDAIVIVPVATPVSIDEPTTFIMSDAQELLGVVTYGTYKCFCISWVVEAQTGLREDLILVNGAIYG